MILLDSSNSLEAVLSSAPATTQPDWSADAVEFNSSFDVSNLIPNSGEMNGTTPVTLVAAPASGSFRQVRSVSLFNLDTAAVTVTIRKSSGPRVLTIVELLPLYTLQYIYNQGWQVLDAAGRVVQREAFAGQLSSVLMPPHFSTANLTSTKTLTSGTTFAVYLGKAPRALSSLIARFRVTTAAATITWAEVAIAKGAINVGGNPTLTVVGFADVAAVINTTGQKSVTINVSNGQQINEGDDLWLLIGNSASTAGIVRAVSIADDLQVGLQASRSGQPSLNVGVGQAYTIEGATTLAAWIAAVV